MNAAARNLERRAQLGIYTRAILLVGLVLAAATTSVTLWNLQEDRDHLTEVLERQLVDLAKHQAAAVANPLWDLNRSAANTILRGLSQDPDFVSAEVRDETGAIFAEVKAKTVPEHLAIRFTEDVMLEELGRTQVIGSVTLTLSRERLITAQRQALIDALVLGAILLAVMMVAVSLILRMVLRPLAEISNRMLAVAAGDLEGPIPYEDRADQIGEVARAVGTFREASKERARAQAALKEAHDEMEQRVEERTEELRRAEALFRSVIAASPAEIFVRDTSGRMLLVNRAWEEAHGVAEKDAVGKTDQDLLPGELANRHMEQDQIVLATGRSLDSEIEQPLEGESKSYHTIKFPLFDSEGKITAIGGINTDITERKSMEERIRQAQKMEAVGQLTGGVAHDFNNLLATIMGSAELLEDRLGQDNRLLGAILRAATRGADLVQRLLAFSRQQPLQPQVIDLGALVSDLTPLLARTLGEAIEIEIMAAPDLWPALADSGQVENALLNLAINARDAMPSGGKLTIECLNAALDEAYAAENPDALPGDYVVLAVTDTGIGMTDEIKAHAFDPFYTTKGVGQGSGLGLSMVYGFAKQSEGHVNIYSEVGKGTTVKLYLPRVEAVPKVEEADVDEAAPRGQGERVLVVEDDADVRGLAVAILEDLGYRTLDVPEAATARRVLEERTQVDLVLSDVVLPGGVSGPELAEELRATHPELPVIFMSGYPAEAARRNGFLGSGKVLLNKPFSRLQIARALRDALKRSGSE